MALRDTQNPRNWSHSFYFAKQHTADTHTHTHTPSSLCISEDEKINILVPQITQKKFHYFIGSLTIKLGTSSFM